MNSSSSVVSFHDELPEVETAPLNVTIIELPCVADDVVFCPTATYTYSYVTKYGMRGEEGLFQTTITEDGSTLQERVAVESDELHFGVPYTSHTGDDFYPKMKDNTATKYITYFGATPYTVEIAKSESSVEIAMTNTEGTCKPLITHDNVDDFFHFVVNDEIYHIASGEDGVKTLYSIHNKSRTFRFWDLANDRNVIPGVIRKIVVGEESILVVSKSLDEGLLDLTIVRF